MIYTVASIEDGVVKLEKSDGTLVFLSSQELSCNVHEGDIIRYDGQNFFVDKAATDNRRRDIYDKYNRLFKK